MSDQPDLEYLASLFHLVDGELRWKRQISGETRGRNPDQPVRLQRTTSGYLYLRVNRTKKLYAHHVIWALHNGRWPTMIDHINGVRDDNRLSNLREASHSLNAKNRRGSSANTTGVTGVTFRTKTNRWIANIGVDGRQVYLGSFASRDEACAARQSAERSNGYSARHGKFLASKPVEHIGWQATSMGFIPLFTPLEP